MHCCQIKISLITRLRTKKVFNKAIANNWLISFYLFLLLLKIFESWDEFHFKNIESNYILSQIVWCHWMHCQVTSQPHSELPREWALCVKFWLSLSRMSRTRVYLCFHMHGQKSLDLAFLLQTYLPGPMCRSETIKRLYPSSKINSKMVELLWSFWPCCDLICFLHDYFDQF